MVLKVGTKLPPRRVDLTGRKFGLLTVTGPAPSATRSVRWMCLCECGGTKDVSASMLNAGNVRSCGCFRRGPNWNRRGTLTHGQSAGYSATTGKRTQSPLYRTWSSMIQRCTNPKAKNYKWYGARGITVCRRWLAFENFAADMGERPDGLSLDRIDNDLLVDSYSKANCRWATQSTQVRNSRRPQRQHAAGA